MALNATDGFAGNGYPGFSSYLAKKGFSHETNILHILPNLEPLDQLNLDIKLNMNNIDSFPNYKDLLISDSEWKKRLIPIFQGKERNPQVVKTLIGVVNNAINSHRNRMSNQLTGSATWNKTWIKVYEQWLKYLYKLLENNG